MRSWAFGKCRLLTFLALVFCLYVIAIYFDVNIGSVIPVFKTIMVSYPRTEVGVVGNSTKKILYWTTMFGDENFYFGESPFQHCPVNDCVATNNREYMNVGDFDAILFHSNDLSLQDLPRERKQEQWYVFVNLESPANRRIPNMYFEDYFNVTLTYRMDSDIPWPYAVVRDVETGEPVAPFANTTWKEYRNETSDREAENEKSLLDVIRGKSKMVTWFVSNCQARSGRMEYVKELSRHIKVDVYGRCGDHTCQTNRDCYREVAELDYFFYLSFENSLCQDYVTEKLYNPLRYRIVPIVYGGANYSLFAPPDSYINVLDFESPKELADYLKRVAGDLQRYRKYFRWKKHYRIDSDSRYAACGLCKFLHERKKPITYERLSDWYSKDKCPIQELLGKSPYATKSTLNSRQKK